MFTSSLTEINASSLCTFWHTCTHTLTYINTEITLCPGAAIVVIWVDNAAFWWFLRLIRVLLITPGLSLKLEGEIKWMCVYLYWRNIEKHGQREVRVYAARGCLRLCIICQSSWSTKTITVHRELWSECALSMTAGIRFFLFIRSLLRFIETWQKTISHFRGEATKTLWSDWTELDSEYYNRLKRLENSFMFFEGFFKSITAKILPKKLPTLQVCV